MSNCTLQFFILLPSSSTHAITREGESPFINLPLEISMFSIVGDVIICGGLNAHTKNICCQLYDTFLDPLRVHDLGREELDIYR
jgi:hypothetical protein